MLREDTPGRCEIERGPALAAETARRLACDASVIAIVEGARGEPLDVGRKTRTISTPLRRLLRARDRGCRFPGCANDRYVDAHHIQHWADGGETKLANLVTLCGFHHGLVHEGGYGLKRTDDGLFIFTRPNGTRIEENGAKCFRGSISSPLTPSCSSFEDCLQDYLRKHEPGLAITPDTSRCQWLGESMDYSQAVEAMQFLERKATAPEQLAVG